MGLPLAFEMMMSTLLLLLLPFPLRSVVFPVVRERRGVPRRSGGASRRPASRLESAGTFPASSLGVGGHVSRFLRRAFAPLAAPSKARRALCIYPICTL